MLNELLLHDYFLEVRPFFWQTVAFLEVRLLMLT